MTPLLTMLPHQSPQGMPSTPLSSLLTPTGVLLPTPSMQDQIHELAKTLPPPRKQNTACDACRSFLSLPFRARPDLFRTRKVKCNRVPGQDKARPLPFFSFAVLLTQTPVPGTFQVLSVAILGLVCRSQHCITKNYPCTSVRPAVK